MTNSLPQTIYCLIFFGVQRLGVCNTIAQSQGSNTLVRNQRGHNRIACNSRTIAAAFFLAVMIVSNASIAETNFFVHNVVNFFSVRKMFGCSHSKGITGATPLVHRSTVVAGRAWRIKRAEPIQI